LHDSDCRIWRHHCLQQNREALRQLIDTYRNLGLHAADQHVLKDNHEHNVEALDDSNFIKAKKYEILGELSANNLIQKSLLLEISDHIEALENNRNKNKYEHNIEFIGDFSAGEQMFVAANVSRYSASCSEIR
jgi:hypothetical protein